MSGEGALGKLTRIIIVILTVFGLAVIGGGIHSIIRKSFNAGIFALGLGFPLLAVPVVLFCVIHVAATQ